MGVSTPPGCTELHRMWSRACWIAVILVNKRTAPLDAIYAGGPMATRPEIDEMFTIEPPPARRMAGMGPRSWDRPLYARRGGLRGAGGSSTDAKIAANIERG